MPAQPLPAFDGARHPGAPHIRHGLLATASPAFRRNPRFSGASASARSPEPLGFFAGSEHADVHP